MKLLIIHAVIFVTYLTCLLASYIEIKQNFLSNYSNLASKQLHPTPFPFSLKINDDHSPWASFALSSLQPIEIFSGLNGDEDCFFFFLEVWYNY
jgi:hypothetical protein